jgi:NitT/TauT family transport system substrate-binding protein
VRLPRARALGLIAGATLVPRRLRAQTATTIRIGVEPVDAYAEPLYGADAGIFGRAGLTLEPTLLRSAGPTSAALAGGALDVGLLDAIVLANAANHGIPLVTIAASGLFRTADVSSALCVSKGSPLRTAKGFDGQTIAVPTLVSLTSVTIRMWLARNGANVANVHLVEMPIPDMPAALQRRTVAAAFIVEPFLTQDFADLQIVTIPYTEIADIFPISVVAASRAWLAANAEPARRFVAALYETAAWANQNRDLTAPILAKYSKIDLDVIHRMHRTLFAASLEPGMLQPILNAAFANKLIDRQTNAGDLIARV